MAERTNVQAFVFCRNPIFKVLILKRTPERSGYWQPVCGGVTPGEKLVDAVMREVEEETGIKDVKAVIDLEYNFTYKENKSGVLMSMQDFCFALRLTVKLRLNFQLSTRLIDGAPTARRKRYLSGSTT